MNKHDRISKIKRMRTWANVLMMMGIFPMFLILGYAYFTGSLGNFETGFSLLFTLVMVICFIFMMTSTIIFMITGMVSMTIPQVTCPTCQKVTKMLGKEDACMYCGQPLLLDETEQQS